MNDTGVILKQNGKKFHFIEFGLGMKMEKRVKL